MHPETYWKVLLGVLCLITGSLVYTELSQTGTQTILVTVSLTGDLNWGVYKDPFGEAIVQSIQWGELSPGDQATYKLYVKNNEAIKTISCSLTTDNWNPTVAEQYITVSWNFDAPLGAGRVRETTLTLNISEDITGVEEFSFTIIIYAS